MQADGGGYIYIYPIGLQKLLELMKRKYQNPKIYITENGWNLLLMFPIKI